MIVYIILLFVLYVILGFALGFSYTRHKLKSQLKRQFIEIVVEYPPDDLCTYPEYKGKPCYSIRYKEHGKEYIGYGTYNPEVLSRYLREYFLCDCVIL